MRRACRLSRTQLVKVKNWLRASLDCAMSRERVSSRWYWRAFVEVWSIGSEAYTNVVEEMRAGELTRKLDVSSVSLTPPAVNVLLETLTARYE